MSCHVMSCHGNSSCDVYRYTVLYSAISRIILIHSNSKSVLKSFSLSNIDIKQNNISNILYSRLHSPPQSLLESHPLNPSTLLYLLSSLSPLSPFYSPPLSHLYLSTSSLLVVLREVQRESYDSLSLNWQSLDPETLCSMINDNQVRINSYALHCDTLRFTVLHYTLILCSSLLLL